MTTTKKLVIAVVALSLALVCVVGGTLAWLVAESNTVTNTFTYGEIKIELWETDPDGGKEDVGLTYEDIVPGDEVDKDPTITVVEGSEACYVYVLITNNLVLDGAPVATYNISEDWINVYESGNSVLYRYKADDPQTAGDLNVFTKVTFNSDLSVDDVNELSAIDEGIVIQAYAHQADNTNVTTADAAAKAWALTATGN